MTVTCARSLPIPIILVALAACGGGQIQPRANDATPTYTPVAADAGAVSAPQGKQAGDSCQDDDCGDPNKLICLAGRCRQICNQPLPGCNARAPECGLAEACVNVSSFHDACIDATAGEGQACDTEKLCHAGLKCVMVGSEGKCLRHCGNGCNPDERCTQTNAGCRVCLAESLINQ